MTPEPDPEPEPNVKTIHVVVGTSLNNAQMLRCYDVKTSQLLTGGRFSITDNLSFDVVLTEEQQAQTTQALLQFKTKGYNNSYTNYTDSYYDDSSNLQFDNNTRTTIIVNASIPDGSTLTVTKTASNEGTYVWS